MAENNQSVCKPQNSAKNYVVSKIYIKIFRIFKAHKEIRQFLPVFFCLRLLLSFWQNNFIFEKCTYFPVIPDLIHRIFEVMTLVILLLSGK